MSAFPTPCSGHWTIRLEPAPPSLTILTLLDPAGKADQHGYHQACPDVAARTVHALEEIPDEDLRASAQQLVNRYIGRLRHSQRNVDAFIHAFPDWIGLVARLQTAVPGCRIQTGLDDDALALRMTISATGLAAGQLLTLIASWPGSALCSTPIPGVDRNLNEDGALTVTMDQERASDFLVWFRNQPRTRTALTPR